MRPRFPIFASSECSAIVYTLTHYTSVCGCAVIIISAALSPGALGSLLECCLQLYSLHVVLVDEFRINLRISAFKVFDAQ